jgi:hypothetical protein
MWHGVVICIWSELLFEKMQEVVDQSSAAREKRDAVESFQYENKETDVQIVRYHSYPEIQRLKVDGTGVWTHISQEFDMAGRFISS